MRAPRIALVLVSFAALASCVLGIPGSFAHATERAPRQEASSNGSPAMGRLASCVTGSKRLAVVLLIDESGSLSETDPGGSRVAAAQVALNGLGSLVERSGGDVQVDLQVAGFGVDFETDAPWTSVSQDSLAGIATRIDGFAERDQGLDTDYVYALRGALTSVQGHAREMSVEGEPACTAVLWFTDGRFDVEDRSSTSREQRGRDHTGESRFKDYAPDIDLGVGGGGARAVEIGKQVLCEPGGIADQFRSTETSLFTVALTTAIEPADEEFLGGVTTGGGCGELDGAANGMLLAGDLSELVGFFDEVVIGLANPAVSLDADLNACPQEEAACAQGTKTFEVDGSLERFHVLAQTDAPGIAVRLSAPGAEPVEIPAAGSTPSGELAAGDTPLTWAWISGNALTIDAESSEDAMNWAGTWSLTFVDTTGTNPGAPVRAQIYLFGDVVPELVEDTEFRAGEPSGFAVRLVRAEGTPIPATSLSGDVSVTASAVDPSTGEQVDLGQLSREDDGTWTGEYRPPEEITSSAVNLTLRTDVTTSSGVALAPAVATVPVVVLPPVGYPSIATRSLAVGPLIGTEPVASTLKVTGSDRADTCVWLSSVSLDPGPVDRGGLAVTAVGAGGTEADCLEIPEGTDADLELEFEANEPQRALATGSIELMTRSANANEARPVEVALDVQLVKPASAGVAWAVFLLLLLVGVGVPLLLFYIANLMVARFAPLRLMEGCSIPMCISESSVERTDGQSDARLVRADDFRAVGGSSELQRGFTFAGVTFDAKVSRNPLRPPHGRATVPGSAVVGSARQQGSGPAGVIPLWVTREWVFVVDPATDRDDPVCGRLVAFLPATDRNAGADAIDLAIRDRLTSIAEKCRSVRPVHEPEPQPVPVGATGEAGPGGSLWSDGAPGTAPTGGDAASSNPWDDGPAATPSEGHRPAVPPSVEPRPPAGAQEPPGSPGRPASSDDLWGE